LNQEGFDEKVIPIVFGCFDKIGLKFDLISGGWVDGVKFELVRAGEDGILNAADTFVELFEKFHIFVLVLLKNYFYGCDYN
jgi:hypothetical protein